MLKFKNIIRVLLLLILPIVPVVAQKDTVSKDAPLISFRGKTRFFLTGDRTSSFVGGKSASTNELKLGFEFKNKIKLGIGIGSLVSDVVVERNILTGNTQKDSLVNAELSLNFFSLNSEYVFYDSKRWQIAMPVGVGIGSSYFSYFENINGSYKVKRLDEGGILILGASGLATYRVLRWVGVSGGTGYRIALISNSKVQESFNSFVYIVKVRIFLGEIYKSVFPKGISGKRDPPYSNVYWD